MRFPQNHLRAMSSRSTALAGRIASTKQLWTALTYRKQPHTVYRLDSAFFTTAALLALKHAAWSVKQLTHDRSGFFDEFYRLFPSLVVP
ncbi:hypothetical protein Y032_0227g2819 [Ancylostoma ceylanicum]|uniref:Uncharacterized protein n=1 Tax=Ancylostoma ceylanicum TaxID=53326 RepID=A0A016SHG6_9BILA|nr:hypothetical protein Y032_0227g2819 [Ancylostoma ceylanicum]